MKELVGKKVMLTKLESIRYKDGHPNGIEKGYMQVGTLTNLEVGQPLVLNGASIRDYFHTSTVLKIEGNLIHTKNSIYKVEEFVPNIV